MEHPEINNLQREIKRMTEYIESLNEEKMTVGDVIDRDVIDEKIIQTEQEIEFAIIKQTELWQLNDLQSICCHEFIEDLVDLTPDKSIAIQYCIHCLYTAN